MNKKSNSNYTSGYNYDQTWTLDNIGANLILKKDLICNHKGLKLLGGHKSWAQKSFGREHFRLNTFH